MKISSMNKYSMNKNSKQNTSEEGERMPTREEQKEQRENEILRRLIVLKRAM